VSLINFGLLIGLVTILSLQVSTTTNK